MGRDRVLGWFVGQVLKATKGQADPELVKSILARLIAEWKQ
jgi:Asp-tRNA(Asn)/Glu-tRNA(Gln) amidotransferase B subunit